MSFHLRKLRRRKRRFDSPKHPVSQVSDAKNLLITALRRKSLVLVGLMGAGKTAIGKRLAQNLSLSFVDADSEIETAAGKTISEIFAEHGEDYFREGEKRVIARLLQSGPQVLATGGGAYMNETTRENIKKSGISIWLRADLDILMERVGRRSHRPLLQTEDPRTIMKKLMDLRYPVYSQADITVQSRDVPHDIIVGEIVSAIQTYLNEASRDT